MTGAPAPDSALCQETVGPAKLLRRAASAAAKAWSTASSEFEEAAVDRNFKKIADSPASDAGRVGGALADSGFVRIVNLTGKPLRVFGAAKPGTNPFALADGEAPVLELASDGEVECSFDFCTPPTESVLGAPIVSKNASDLPEEVDGVAVLVNPEVAATLAGDFRDDLFVPGSPVYSVEPHVTLAGVRGLVAVDLVQP